MTTNHQFHVEAANSEGAIDGQIYRQVMGQFLAGVTIITAAHETGPVGMAVSSFSSLSMDPPLVLFCPQKRSATWALIEAAGQFAVNILAVEDEHVSRQMSSKVPDKFAGLDWHTRTTGAPVLNSALGWIDCDIADVHEGGDHWVAVGRVRSLGWREGSPLAYHRGSYGSFAPNASN